MNYRRLGRSGLKVSELSFGSWVTYGNQLDLNAARDCMAAAEKVLSRCPDDVRALSLAACVLPQLGRDSEAVGWSERAATLEPEEPFVNFNAACVYIALHDYDRAIHYFRRVKLSAAGNYNWILQDPCLDPVRTHPQFAALLSQYAAA